MQDEDDEARQNSAGAAAQRAAQFGAEEKQQLERRLKAWFRQDIAAASAWRKEAREDFAFYNGEQWAEEDRAALAEQKRPVMTFNRIAPLVNAVIGSEINNRREVRYIPREQGDSEANEILTGAGEWFRECADAEDEESEAFADMVISGMGFVDTRLDFDKNPDGEPVIARLDPMKMAWDARAVKGNLTDAERLWYIDEKPYHEVKALFPDCDPRLLHAAWARTGAAEDGAPHKADGAALYENEEFARKAELSPDKMCVLVECRWFETESYYRAVDSLSGQLREYSGAELEAAKKADPDFAYIRQYRKAVRRAFLGAGLLAAPDKPLTPPGQLGWECITGYYSKSARQFYGLVRPAKDPQRWTNKFFSQVMYLLNSQSKGGIMAERGAFDDDGQAEESWARADSITWAKPGAITGRRVEPKPVAQFPSGFFTLFNESKEAIAQVTGLSPEFIGTREVNQPGILEHTRRQSSLNLLASLFNALRRYRKRQGKIVLHLLQNFLSDGRLIRIVGPDKARYVPLTRTTAASSEYDIIVDDAPTSPNEKERTFAIIQQIMPALQNYMTPEIGLEILRYSPLPASLTDSLARLYAQSRQSNEA